MDESEEEALFARLHAHLTSRGSDRRTLATPEIATALARVESSLRSLAIGLEKAGQRTDGLEKGLDARIEAVVARSTAALRIDLDRLESRFAPESPRDTVRPGFAWRAGWAAGIIVMLLVALGGFGLVGMRLGYLPAPDLLGPALLGPALGADVGERPIIPAQPAEQPNGGRLVRPAAVQSSSPPPTLSQAGQPPAPRPSEEVGEAPPSPRVAASPSATALPVPPPQMAQPAPLPARPESGPAATRAEGPAPPVPPAAVAAASPPRPASQPAAPGPAMLTIRATAPAWTEVRDGNGRALLRRTLLPGETWQTRDGGDLQLSTGFAAGLAVSVDGKPFPLPSGSAVIHNLRLPGAG